MDGRFAEFAKPLRAREGPRQAGIVRGVRSSKGGVQGAGVRPRWRDYRDFFGVE